MSIMKRSCLHILPNVSTSQSLDEFAFSRHIVNTEVQDVEAAIFIWHVYLGSPDVTPSFGLFQAPENP